MNQLKRLVTRVNRIADSITVPGDKSISHRALIIGAISHGKTTIKNISNGKDCTTTMKILSNLGVKISKLESNVIIYGRGIEKLSQPSIPLDMENSGTTARLMMGVLAGTNFNTQIIGDESLSSRPMERVSKPLKRFGGEISLSNDRNLPANVHGTKLNEANIFLDIASAQVKGALIFVAIQAEKESYIHEYLPTRDHTEIMLNKFGADIKILNNRKLIKVYPKPYLKSQDINIYGNMSSAAFFLVAGVIIKNSKLTVRKVNLNPTRIGVIEVLKRMNAKISIKVKGYDLEPFGDVTVESSNLESINLDRYDIPLLIDELPLIALLASCAVGKSSIRGAKELRFKETDRIKTIATELRKLGVNIIEKEDGMDIFGRKDWCIEDNILSSHGDHRIGMMVAIAALKSQETLYLLNEDAVEISYPNLFEDLSALIN